MRLRVNFESMRDVDIQLQYLLLDAVLVANSQIFDSYSEIV